MDDVDFMCMLCGGDVDDVEFMCMLCGGDVDDSLSVSISDASVS